MASALQGQVLRTHLVIMILTSASRKGITHAPYHHDLDQRSKDRYYARTLSS
jgi:hypothetical protein